MSKEICVKFNSGMPCDAREEIISILSQWFIVKESEEYDYYFAMETIYTDQKNMLELLNSDNSAVRIMICGEAIYPDLNLFDYAIFYWSHFDSMDRIIYRPYIYTLEGELFESIDELDDLKKGMDFEKVLSEKKKFCNFIYSNPDAHYKRDELFYTLSKYKTVDSLGSHLCNVEIKNTRYENGWRKISVELKKPYKFSIAAENAKFPGYTTEKMITSMLALTVPIYFGNPVVGEMFNSNSFINVDDYVSGKELVDCVKEIDENDQLWCDIMSQHWRTEEQIYNSAKTQKEFFIEMKSIFEKDKKASIRRSMGTWDLLIYPKHISNHNDNRKGNFRRIVDIFRWRR